MRERKIPYPTERERSGPAVPARRDRLRRGARARRHEEPESAGCRASCSHCCGRSLAGAGAAARVGQHRRRAPRAQRGARRAGGPARHRRPGRRWTTRGFAARASAPSPGSTRRSARIRSPPRRRRARCSTWRTTMRSPARPTRARAIAGAVRRRGARFGEPPGVAWAAPLHGREHPAGRAAHRRRDPRLPADGRGRGRTSRTAASSVSRSRSGARTIRRTMPTRRSRISSGISRSTSNARINADTWMLGPAHKRLGELYEAKRRREACGAALRRVRRAVEERGCGSPAEGGRGAGAVGAGAAHAAAVSLGRTRGAVPVRVSAAERDGRGSGRGADLRRHPLPVRRRRGA